MDDNNSSTSSRQRRISGFDLKAVWIGIGLLVVLVAALLALNWKTVEDRILTSPPAEDQPDDPQDPAPDSESNKLNAYYYTANRAPDYPSQYKIFQVSPSLSQSDVNTHRFSLDHQPVVITDPWKKGTLLLVSNSETEAVIYTLDLSTKNSTPQPLLTVPLNSDQGEKVSQARFVDDGKAIAFITYDRRVERAENSVLRIVSLQDKTQKESYPLNEKSPLYAGFDLLAATPDSRSIYLSETGGDAGHVWSSWYKVDRTAETVQRLDGLPPMAKGEKNPTESAFSPDRSKLAYTDLSTVVKEEDLNYEGYDTDTDIGPCLKYSIGKKQKYKSDGGVIMIQDLETGNTKEVYRNLDYSRNLCKMIARRIISLKWLDNSRVAFETIDGIYALDINTQERETLFTFEKTISPAEQKRPSIQSIQPPFIILSDQSIVHTDTNKRLELISTSTEKRYLFSFD